MIDYSKPTAQMLGRWQPFHDGHLALFKEILKKTGQVVIMVRSMPQTENNPFIFEDIKKRIEEKLQDYVGKFDVDETIGTGMVGAPACGDVMKLQIKVEDGIITDARFKTYGCGSAIASSSLVTEWVKGRTLAEAEQIKNSTIADELALPPVKIHCSILAEDAIKAAVADYRNKHSLPNADI